MADREGNVLHVPGTGTKAEVKGDEILGSMDRLIQKGLTLKQAAIVLETGTVLKASSTQKKYAGAAKADTAVVGILRKGVDLSGSDMLGNVVLGGVVKGSKVRYTDDQDGLSAAELATLAGQLGGRYDAVHDYLIF